PDPMEVRLGRVRGIDFRSGEDVADLADAVNGLAGLAHERQVVRPLRLQREVMPVRRPLVVPGLADEGPRDHTPHPMLASQDLARDPTALVQLLEGNRLPMRRALEDGISRRVDDPLARPLVLLAELLDDLGARGRLVAEHAAAG